MRHHAIYAWRRAAIPLVVTVMMIQGGCLSGPAPRDRFYRREIPDAVARFELPRSSGRLLVDSVRGDAMTSERRMLYRNASEPYQVRREGYDNWVDSPPVMIQPEVVAFLRSANAAEAVITPEMRLDADFRLGGRVERFERFVDPGSSRATIELEFTLVRVEDREPLLLESYSEHEDVAGSGAGDSVEAFSRALHRILERRMLDLSEVR